MTELLCASSLMQTALIHLHSQCIVCIPKLFKSSTTASKCSSITSAAPLSLWLSQSFGSSPPRVKLLQHFGSFALSPRSLCFTQAIAQGTYRHRRPPLSRRRLSENAGKQRRASRRRCRVAVDQRASLKFPAVAAFVSPSSAFCFWSDGSKLGF